MENGREHALIEMENSDLINQIDGVGAKNSRSSAIIDWFDLFFR